MARKEMHLRRTDLYLCFRERIQRAFMGGTNMDILLLLRSAVYLENFASGEAYTIVGMPNIWHASIERMSKEISD